MRKVMRTALNKLDFFMLPTLPRILKLSLKIGVSIRIKIISHVANCTSFRDMLFIKSLITRFFTQK